jgi:hypothetical protein|tara:strand:+ start:50 stop:226 length:177 start_codon:yes stop_codon:yes gene_type:complete
VADKEYFITVEGVVSDVYRITAANEVYASREAQEQFKAKHKSDCAITVRVNKNEEKTK